MKRPDTVPAHATWNEKVNQWELGTHNAEGTRIGIWKSWREEGYLCTVTDYDTAAFTGYHPDGSISREGTYTWPGSMRWIRSAKPSPEAFPIDLPKKSNIWIVEYDFSAPYIASAQRFFNKKNEPLCEAGMPLPARPAGVPERAHFRFVAQHDVGSSKWILGQLDTRQGKYIETYENWNDIGVKLVKSIYDPVTFEETERYAYYNGLVSHASIQGPGDRLLETAYYRDVEPLVPEKSILYLKEGQDVTHTWYDTAGNVVCTIHDEVVDTYHKRKHFNGILIYEGILSEKNNRPPISVNYYYPDGTISITYKSNHDGTGNWELYEENGVLQLSLPVQEAEYNKSGLWNRFLTNPGWIEHVNFQPEWEVIIEKFKTACKEQQSEKKQHPSYPPFLQQELHKTDWAEIDCAMGKGETIPGYIIQLIGDDDALSDNAFTKIWNEIEHQGTVYDATYKVGIILITCILHFHDNPDKQRLLLNFLFDVLALPGIEDDKKLYRELIRPLTKLSPVLLNKANDDDDVIALKALYMLYHTGPASATLLKQTYENNAFSLFRRSYALFSLGELYLKTKQVPILITAFTTALPGAKEALIRLILSIHLVTATKKEAQEAWLAELVNALANPEPVKRDFNELHPFIGDYDVQEYILMVLSYTRPDILERNIAPIIDMLPAVHAMKQETLLDAIFSVLFAKKTAVRNITPIRKKALLAAADVIDKEVVFVNHKDIFRAYGLPADAGQLRQLAEK